MDLMEEEEPHIIDKYSHILLLNDSDYNVIQTCIFNFYYDCLLDVNLRNEIGFYKLENVIKKFF